VFSNDLKTEFNSAQVLVVVPSLHNPFFYNLFVLAITYAHQNSMKVRVTYLNNHKETCSNCKELTSARDNFKKFLLKLEIETIEVKYQSKIEIFQMKR
jgi:DNA-binding LacI/PurR family transcriptional regulator